MKHCLALFLVSVLLSCGGTSGGTSSDSDNFFYTSSQQVAPSVLASASSSSVKVAALSGTVLPAIYTAMREYQNPRDEGVIDMSNIYKVLWEAGNAYSDATTLCTQITEKAINSPYPLGPAETYTCAGNSGKMSDAYAKGFAIKTVGNTKYSLLSYRWCPEAPNHLEHGVLQGSHDAVTGDLSMKMVHDVEYTNTSPTSGFTVRTHIDGNEKTHAFTLSFITVSWSGTSASSWVSVVGKGFSRGSGKYFLFRAKTINATEKYFCIPADTTEALLETVDADGTDTPDVNCLEYKAAVDEMSFLTTEDVPTTIADFDGSTILLTY